MEFTLVGLTLWLLNTWIMLRFSNQCSGSSFALRLIVWCWQNCQNVLRRLWRGLERHRCKAKTIGKGMSHSLSGHPGGFAWAGLLQSWRSYCTHHVIFRLWAKFSSFFLHEILGVGIWNFNGLLSGYVSVYQRISLDCKYLWLISCVKVGEKIGILTISTEKGKKYHNSIININFMNFNAYIYYSCCAESFDILQAMFWNKFFLSLVHSMYCT